MPFFEAVILASGVLGPGAGGSARWLRTASPRAVLNVWYAYLARSVSDRAAFDRDLWSDPQRERAILKALETA